MFTFLQSCVSLKNTDPIPNFRQVDPGVYRGGQPTQEGWNKLKALGVTTVVKLNLDKEGSDAEAVKLGMDVWDLGINVYEQTGLEQIPDGFFDSICLSLPEKGIYIHCEHGQDRTGLCCAIYRMRVDKWTKDQAQTEMLQNGFHKSLLGLWEYWEDYNAR